MDKLPVGQLPDISQSSLDDEIMIITEADTSQLRKEKISNILTDIISVQENNALVKGSDDKLFVTNFGNASNITEGKLPVSVLPDIPKDLLPAIETSDLPVSGVSADTYAYPSSVTVNAQGQVTGIVEGAPGANNANQDLSNLSPEGEKHFLNKSQVTNCILEAPNGVATYSGSTITVKQGLKVLIPNGRNADGTLNNIEYTLGEDVNTQIAELSSQEYCYLFYVEDTNVSAELTGNSLFFCIEEKYFESNIEPQNPVDFVLWLDTYNNIYKRYMNSQWNEVKIVKIASFNYESSTITSLTPYQPVELLKRSDKVEITSWGIPNHNATTTLTLPPAGQIYTVPYDCYMYFCDNGSAGGGDVLLRLNSSSGAIVVQVATANNDSFSIQGITFAKGTKLYVQRDKNIAIKTICPLIGAEI